MKRVIITGADGFIGSHLVRHFAARDTEIVAITIPNSPCAGRIQGIPGVTVIQAALEEWTQFAQTLPQEPDALIHLAWAGVSPEDRGRTAVQAANIDLCMAATYLAAQIHAKRFILPGSTMEYSYCGQPINDQALPSPQNAYGAAKIAARYLCQSLCKELNIPYIYTVITGIYAADRTDNNVIYYTITQLLRKQRPSLTKLEQRWDYVHIEDVSNAFYLIATKGKGGSFYTVGHGDNWLLADYICRIRDLIDPTLPLGIGEMPYQDRILPSSCVDLTLLQEDTGYTPQISFEAGIQDVIDAIRKTIQ